MNTTPLPTPIEIPAAPGILRAILNIPANARSIIVFAHGLDSCHLSPRNRMVARSLLQRGFAVLLPDLTDSSEPAAETTVPQEPTDILQTATRLVAVIDWLAANPATANLSIGLFGARTGAAATMIAAALRPAKVRAVVSRGGRPDLAADLLGEVQAPTLMLVGSHDPAVIAHNRQAGEKMVCKPMLEVIQGASHLFGEPGKLEQVASISYQWFHRTLALCG